MKLTYTANIRQSQPTQYNPRDRFGDMLGSLSALFVGYLANSWAVASIAIVFWFAYCRLNFGQPENK